ncbi:MAG: hypothetical protein SchgKO_01880 [Schleiferiaceae bacterium]
MAEEWIGNWKRKKREIKYENPWIKIYHDEVVNPNGGEGIYGVVDFQNTAIGVIPIDENGNTWLVGQHRYPLNTYTWEIPEGGGPIGTDPRESALRELEEEIGYSAKSLVEIQRMQLSNSATNEEAIMYVATDLFPSRQAPDPTEDLQIEKIPVLEAIDRVLKGEITDSMSVAGLLKLKILLDSGEFKL